MNPEPIRVLFLCTGNDCRSQMAEAWLRHHGAGRFVVSSAGAFPRPIHPMVRGVMREAGVSLAEQSPKGASLFAGQSFDHIVNVCERARETAQLDVAGRFKLHYWNLENPVGGDLDDEEARWARFRRVRDAIELNCIAFIREALCWDLALAC
jgi:arsenate reductase